MRTRERRAYGATEAKKVGFPAEENPLYQPPGQLSDRTKKATGLGRWEVTVDLDGI